MIQTSGEGDDLVTSGTCGAVTSVNSTGVYLASGTPAGVSIAVLVPDGFTTAVGPGRQVSVANNLAVLPQGRPGTVVLRGSQQAEQKIDLGSF